MDIKGITPAALPVSDLRVPQPLKSAQQPTDKERAAVKKVASEFETLFVNMMMKSMRSTVGEDKLTGGGHGEEMYRSLLDEEYAKRASASGSLGLAAMIERQLAPPAPVVKEGSSAD